MLAWKAIQPVEVQTKAVERTRLNLPDPKPIEAKEIQWIIVTKDNAQEVFKKLEEKGIDSVLFGLTDEGYVQLSLTIAELRNLINNQRSIIIKYKEYYEPPSTESKK